MAVLGILILNLVFTTCIIASTTAGAVVFPVVIQSRGNQGSQRKLAIHENHILNMDPVSIFADTYVERIFVNGSAMDILSPSSVIHENMFQCTENFATYTISFKSGHAVVNGIVNTTHAIKPIRKSHKSGHGIPHKLFKIVRFNSKESRRSKTEAWSGQNMTNTRSQLSFPEERGSASLVEPRNARGPRNLRFKIEVSVVVDYTLSKRFNFQRRIAVYVAVMFNVVKLKIETMKNHKITIQVVGIRQTSVKDREQAYMVERDDYAEIDKTFDKFAQYAVKDAILNQADIVVLLTGKRTATWSKGWRMDVGGVSTRGKICDPQRKATVLEDLDAQYSASNTAPHEIGHLLGSPHDGYENTQHPGCSQYGHIMAPDIEADSAHTFSACSENAIKDHLETMSDETYYNCICLRQPDRDFLFVQTHLAPPDVSTEQYCKGTQGPSYAYAEMKSCKIYCYHYSMGSLFDFSYTSNVYAAPYGFSCGKGKVCYFGRCVACTDIGEMTPWKNCEKH